MKKVLCAFCGLLVALSIRAGSSEFSYEIKDNGDGTCVLTAVHGIPNVKVELPSVVIGKTVTSLGDGIFKDYPDDDDEFVIPEVVIPDTVTKFSRSSFLMSDSYHIGRVVLPTALKHIEGVDYNGEPGWRIFYPDELTSLTFSKGRTSNADGTYFLTGEGNRMLVHKGVTSKGDEYQNLITYAGCDESVTIRIPDGITGIAAGAFNDVRTQVVSFPASLKQLGDDWGLGFHNNLEKVEIRGKNEGPYRIIGNSLVDTRTKTLMQATVNTVIPSDGSVTRIETWSFNICPYSDGVVGDLLDIVVPDAVEEIGTGAFMDVGSSSFTVGKGIRLIEGGAFSSLHIADEKGMRFFSISTDNPIYEVVNGCIIRKTDNTFVSPAMPQKQYRVKVDDVPGVEYEYEYDLEVPYYCEKILSRALKNEYIVRTLVLPKNLAYDDDAPWYDRGLMSYSAVEHIRIADCNTMTDVLNSDIYASLKDNLQEVDASFEGFTFTNEPQIAVRTVGAVTVSGYGRYAPSTNVTLKAIYVEKGKQVVWYRYNEAREESSRTKVGEGNSLSFEMPQGNVFFSAELIDAIDGGDDSSESELADSYGPFVPGAKVEIAIPTLVGYAAKGLPSGLKFNKKTGAITGAAKKPTDVAGQTVTFSKKGAETLTTQFIVGAIPKVSVSLAGDTEKCKVSGGDKAYLAGKTVKLTAKAPKGTAFVGWTETGTSYLDAESLKGAKLSFEMPEGDITLVANFEKEQMTVACPKLAEGSYTVGVSGDAADGLPLEIETQSGVKSVKAKNLPKGMKLVVDKETGAWSITGTPSKLGTYNVVITVTATSGATESITIPVTVAALPSWAVGTFEGVGFCKDSNGEPDEEILWGTLTIADNGKIKGKMMYETEDERLLTTTVSEKSMTAYDPETSNYYCDITLTFKDGSKVVSDTFRFTVAPANYDKNGAKVGTVSYEDNDLFFELSQNIWKVKSFAGSKPVFAQSKTTLEKAFSIRGDADVKDGTVILTLNVDKNGAVSGTILAQGLTYESSHNDQALEAFEEKLAINKTNLIITDYVAATSAEGKGHYSAIVPVVLNKKDVKGILYVEVKLIVSQDGKIYQENCEITTHTDIGDWSE